MARPIKRRRICQLPKVVEFVPLQSCTGQIDMTIDEYEAIRLIDHLGLSQEECAQQMKVARTTVQAIYESARHKLAEALVCGKRLSIRGGVYDLCPHANGCCGKPCPRRQTSEER